jgi:signal transduction histidine kinase/DNA-binding response OmpR family regulator
VRYPQEEAAPELLGFVPDLERVAAPLGDPEGILRLVMSTKRQAAQYRQIFFNSAAGVLLVLGLGALLAFALSRGLVRGIEQLAQGATRIGAGELGLRIQVHGSPEVEALAHTFNDMAAKIHEYQQDLERKVEARTAELSAARFEAERANQAKTEFLANVSHEIRTPLTSILGYADPMLDDDSTSSAESRERVEVIRRNGTHLVELVNDILDVSRIEAGRLEIERLSMAPTEVVAEAASLLRRRAQGKGLRLDVRFQGLIPSAVKCSPTRILQALMNLAGNAIKFTESGRVQLLAAYDRDSEILRLQVRDTGSGIPPDKLSTIFLPFEQADSSTTRRFAGTGLGLAITKRLAQMLGGDCMVESELGVGSVFTFTGCAPLAEGAEFVELPSSQAQPREAPQLAKPPPAPLQARILLAEDSPDNQRLISTLLKKAGAEVTMVENGRLAVERLQQESFDLVLMDMAMPEMDGYEATRTLREMGLELPIVALTAHAMGGERERCLEVGCSEYLTKPVNRELLVTTIRSLLEKPAKSVDPIGLSNAPSEACEGKPHPPVLSSHSDEALTPSGSDTEQAQQNRS